ncbi:hypothetical protein Misp01_71070 [Microtetraspora sp. NBRC 13810]|uniref:type II toxin-antitoxin system Phd/YefM family antitoxin n=1 Tax=Microtetraspora sp. NBRC 13810 TaxID=3030990 RepID=UPI0024A04EF6|nr:type II toxin-antitoxin system Phd/YefM family antitoxin [Microtetraspora sp. NBRC 13810]GLW11979.1 hypothetical protein Misp01_71070 [Microtetraspora sp. NBRC 13810]
MTAEKSQVSRGDVHIYKMRDLNQRTAEVIQEINDSGRPAIITRHGQFVALISPLLNKGLEGELIARFLDQEAAESGRDAASADTEIEGQGETTEDLARRLGLDWP